ncbi:hypothetical protein M407DRAFT_23869 [Tulasnella calospora MUT 4182]|uniref:Protein kinase domain-containing protein n=1 Tax=Tulasnella calospora MUT 4182 TaxID=1051891 RepID=A0A0C3LZW4_9AGAM|nr:hypothetical protein M407DRAFT_23869 [Tulasnella calospora MUT 4182]
MSSQDKLETPPHLSRLKIGRKRVKITDTRTQGRGATSEIKKGTLDSGVVVAVKMFQTSTNMDKRAFSNSFLHEVAILASLCHPNVVELLGFTHNVQKGVAWIIFPWELGGNVRDFLKDGEWDLPERMSLIQDVCLGLHYLHNHEPPICHGDLKSLNILVNAFNRGVITDFGCTRINPRSQDCGETQASSRLLTAAGVNLSAANDALPTAPATSMAPQKKPVAPGYSTRWAAPELLLQVETEAEADLRSDIWAFGLLCWEIITGHFPFHDISAPGRVIFEVMQGKVPNFEADERMSQLAGLCDLMKSCLVHDPNKRPDAARCLSDIMWMASQDGLATNVKTDGPKSRNPSLLCQLGHIHRLRDDFKEAESSYEEALKNSADAATKGKSLVALGELARVQGSTDASKRHFDEAATLYSSIGHELGQANVLVELGHVHFAESKYDEAAASFTRAQEVYAKLGDDMDQLKASGWQDLAYQNEDSFLQMVESYAKARATYAHTGDRLGGANALAGLGEVYYAEGQYAEAEKSHKQAERIFAELGDNLGRANALRGIGNAGYAQCHYTEAERFLTQAEEIYRRVGSRQGRANALEGLGSVYTAQSNFGEAEKRLSTAQEIYAEIHDRLGEANAAYGLGFVYAAFCKFSKASSTFAKARAIYSDIGDKHGVAHALSGLGEVYHNQGKHKEAKESLEMAESMYLQNGDNLGLANTLRVLGDVSQSQRLFTEAENFYLRAKDLSTRIGDDHGSANVLNGLGGVYCAKSRFEKARECYDEAAGVYTALGDELGRASVLKGAGDLALAEQRYDDAEGRYEEAQDCFSRVGNDMGMADVCLRRGHVRREQRQYNNAAGFYEKAKGLYSSIPNDEGRDSARDWLDVVSAPREGSMGAEPIL